MCFSRLRGPEHAIIRHPRHASDIVHGRQESRVHPALALQRRGEIGVADRQARGQRRRHGRGRLAGQWW